MGFTEVFSRKKEVTLTLEEQQKENKQLIRKACRELNREKNALERQEKKTVMDIKAAAKKGQMGSVKIMAKDLVRNRKYQAKFMEMQSNLQGVQLKMRAMNSSQQMAQAMSGVTKAMKMTTKNMDIQGINQMMMEFQRESEKMNLMGDMVRQNILFLDSSSKRNSFFKFKFLCFHRLNLNFLKKGRRCHRRRHGRRRRRGGR